MAGPLGQERDRAHPERNRFAVQEARIAGFGLQRVAHRVPQVEDHAQAALALVGGNHLGLDAHAFRDQPLHHLGLAGQHFGVPFLQQREQRRAADDAALEDFEQAGAVFPLGQRREHLRIDQHRDGLVESADQVLAALEVHPGLTADSRIHLRQQRSGNLQHRNPAHVDGGQKARHVVDHTAAESDHQARTVAPAQHHLLGEHFDRSQPFSLFAAGIEQDLVGTARQSASQPRAV